MPVILVQPSELKGKISLPASKSHSMRALVFAALASGESEISNLLNSPDTQAMHNALRLIGADVYRRNKKVYVEGCLGQVTSPDDIIYCGNSGQVLRFISALLGLQARYAVVTGDQSICQLRPMAPLLAGLRQLGAECFSLKEDERAPIIIKGPVRAGAININGADSQPISALLMMATQVAGETTIRVQNPGEIPWINLTLSWFDRLGLQYRKHDDGHYSVPGPQVIPPFRYHVVGDLSAMAYPVIAAIITQSIITIEQVDLSDAQGDKAILDILQSMGAQFDYQAEQQRLTVRRVSQLNGGTFDLNQCIDAVPVFAVLACFAKEPVIITNVAIARQKESNRLQTICAELKKMGADIQETEDGLHICPSKLHGATVQAHADHRIAMSLAVAGLAASDETIIEDAQCIEKSFPDFVIAFKQLQAKMNNESSALA